MKLFAIVNTFNKKQCSKFLIYIQLYHKPESLVYKISYWLEKEGLWKKGYLVDNVVDWMVNNLPFNVEPQKLSNTLSRLGTLAEEYLGWLMWKDSESQKRASQSYGLAQNSLPDQFLKTKKVLFDKSNRKVISIWDDYYKLMTLFHNYYFGISSTEDNYLKEFDQMIDTFISSTSTIGQILQVEIKNRERLLGESWDQYGTYFKLFNRSKNELSDITHHLVLLNKKGDIDSYNYLISLLHSDKIKRFSRFIQYSIVSYCSIFLLGKIKTGETIYGQELLDLYEFSLEKEIFNLNNTMSIIKYVNIIGIASKLGKPNWARKIVDNWAQRVDTTNHKSNCAIRTCNHIFS